MQGSAKASRQEGFSQLLKDEVISPASPRLSSFSFCGCSEVPSGQSLSMVGRWGPSWCELLVDEPNVKSLTPAVKST